MFIEHIINQFIVLDMKETRRIRVFCCRYRGYIPHLKYAIGKTYGNDTHDLAQVSAGCGCHLIMYVNRAFALPSALTAINRCCRFKGRFVLRYEPTTLTRCVFLPPYSCQYRNYTMTSRHSRHDTPKEHREWECCRSLSVACPGSQEHPETKKYMSRNIHMC